MADSTAFDDWPFAEPRPNAALRAALLGDPIAHSRSPKLHGHWLKQYGIDGAYVSLRVESGGLREALQALADHGFAGCNLTIPHKVAALGMMQRLEGAAIATRAVNTVIFRRRVEEGWDAAAKAQNAENPIGIRGCLAIGRNTDADGFIQNLREAVDDLLPHLRSPLLIGAGGAARAALYALLEAGAEKVILVNRTLASAQELARDRHMAKIGTGRIEAADWRALPELLPQATLIVNATSLGMQGQPPLVLPWETLPPEALVTDMVYAPLETELLARAKARGCRTLDGLGMLLYQARGGFEAWFGRRPEVTPALRAAVLA